MKEDCVPPWRVLVSLSRPTVALAAQASRRAAERISFEGKTWRPRHRLA